MSQTDSFIDEVTEEVRKDKLFAYMRRYAWIAVLAVLVIVGGAAYNEWKKAQQRSAAQALGDSVLSALQLEDQGARASALYAIEAPNPESQAMIDLLAAAEMFETDPAAAAARLTVLADNPAAPTVYRQIAILKMVAMPGGVLSIEERRRRLDELVPAGGLTGLLAREQLAMIEIEEGNIDSAIERLQAIIVDAETTSGLLRRSSQVIVALGGTLPENGESQ